MKHLLYILSLLAAICCTPAGEQSGTGSGSNPEFDYTSFERVPLQSKIRNIQPMTGVVLWHNNSKCATEIRASEFAI